MRALAAERDSYREMALVALDQLHQQTRTIAALREDVQRMTTPVTPARTCRHCGAPFTPAYELQAFCRPTCRQAHCAPKSPQGRLPLGDPAGLFEPAFEPATRRGRRR